MVELTARIALESMMAATADDARPIIRRLARIQARTVLDQMKATPDAAASEAGEVYVDREEIARVLFDQRQTPHDFDDAADADPESDAGTLRSICFDDADAVIAALTTQGGAEG